MKFELKNNRLFIVSYNGYFGHGLNVDNSLNIDILYQNLCENFDVKLIDVQDLLNMEIKNDDFFWITSHQNPDVKKYLNDISIGLFLDSQEQIIPSLKLYLSHDNKGIQSLLYNKGKDIGLINQQYKLDYCLINDNKVFKTISGAGGQGVSIVNNNKMKKKLLELRWRTITIFEMKMECKEFVKKIFSRNRISYSDYIRKRTPYVLQDFIPSLKYDYKVLVFMENVYVLKRNVRKGDFRASGSGNFEFVRPNKDLVSYALNVRSKVNTPFISLDIAELPESYHCIEYQATHFGPYTKINAKEYYRIIDNELIAFENTVSLEEEYSNALVKYIKNVI